MTGKYKVSDLAKDFNIKSKDLIEIINESIGVEKKSGATINEEEISAVFAYITAKNSVKSFDQYFATGKESQERAKKVREEKRIKN